MKLVAALLLVSVGAARAECPYEIPRLTAQTNGSIRVAPQHYTKDPAPQYGPELVVDPDGTVTRLDFNISACP